MTLVCCEKIRLTKPTNTLHLSHEISKGQPSVFLIHESEEIIKSLNVKEFTGREIVLAEMIDTKSVRHGYWQEVDEFNRPIGKKIRENIFVQVFYEYEGECI